MLVFAFIRISIKPMHPFWLNQETLPGYSTTHEQIWNLEDIRAITKSDDGPSQCPYIIEVRWKNLPKETTNRAHFTSTAQRDSAFRALYKEIMVIATKVRVESFPA